MNVTLISTTPDALTLLLGTKNTRLGFNSDPSKWSVEQRSEHLAYMKDTIKSSWEFVDYVFKIEGVTRAFTHQLVRTRTGSYAQESQRTVDASENGFLNPFRASEEAEPKPYDSTLGLRTELFDASCFKAFHLYKALLDDGAAAQDARGVLPTATLTNIVAKFNLRTLHDMAKLRLCTRTQGEYQTVFRQMRDAVIAVHPWVGEYGFLEVHCVSVGTCAFPRFGKKECQHYDPRMDLDAVKEETRVKFWAKEVQVAKPVAVDGKTM